MKLGAPTASFNVMVLNRMPLQFVGKIRDPLHDNVPFTELEKKVIDHKYFQRLRRIGQTAFIKFAFPGATHTRFEHSLGVMHLSGVMLSSLLANQTNLLDQRYINLQPHSLRKTFEALTCLRMSSELCQLLRLAALLHDVGHSPYSHSGERFMPTWEVMGKQASNLMIPEYLKQFITHTAKENSQKNHAKKVKHELYTLMLISKIFSGSDLKMDESMGRDICSIIEPRISPTPGGELHRSDLQNLFHQIISGEIDVDRMDYLMRDSLHSGVVYGWFDAGRLLDSTCFYYNFENESLTKTYHLALRKQGVSVFEDYLRARWSMYQQLYFHKTATCCEAMMEKAHEHLASCALPIDPDSYALLDDTNFMDYVMKGATSLNDAGKQLLEDLLLNRRLWKRVFEEHTTSGDQGSTKHKVQIIGGILDERGIDYAVVKSSTSLTRFSPAKNKDLKSLNSLQVIVRNERGQRRLIPIEDLSGLVSKLTEEKGILRIFMSRTTSARNGACEPVDMSQIQQEISAALGGESILSTI